MKCFAFATLSNSGEVLLEQYLGGHRNPKAAEYYLCGPPLMIKACTKMLAELEVPVHQIAYDEF